MSFLLSSPSLPTPLLLPPPQITAVFTRALRDLPTRPRVRSDSPHRAKKNPPKSYRASCLLTHWMPPCVDNVVFCVRVGACLRQTHSLQQFFSSHKIPLVSSSSLSIVSLSHFTFFPWCRVSLISLQDYTVKNLLLLLFVSWPGFSSTLANTHIYTGLHCAPHLSKEPTVFC